jgi:hypothetical protein
MEPALAACGLTLDPKEVLEARLVSPADLPEAHRELAASL